jgi:outer membrane receptor protein involved in Fe transport
MRFYSLVSLPFIRSVALVSLLVLLASSRSSAQQASADINGTIMDATGAVVEGAEITLRNVQTGVTRTSVSNTTGTYVFVDVLPAAYTMQVSKVGFETISQPQFTMNVNQTATFNFHLTVGSAQQTVTVEATAVAIQASTAELGTVINEQSVNELPLNGRNFTQLLTLTPGASPVSVAQNSGGGGGFAGNAIGSFSFPALNGQRNRSNMFLLDGINDLGSFIGNYNFSPIVDTVQEFKVQSHNDEAEFGQAAGGIVNVVSKSGTNDFHGSLWEFLRNEKLDARNFFLAKRNPLRQNQFGVAGGGPVWIPKVYNGKNRTFFYGGYEGFRQSQTAQSLLLTPSNAELNGDFSAIQTQLYNPFTTRPDPSRPGNYIRDPFANNQIPTNLFNPAAVLYAKTLFPPAGAVGPTGTNAVDLTPSKVNQNSYNGRIDQVFNEHDTLFGRISYYDQNNSSSAGYPGAITPVVISGWNWGLHETHTFGPTSILDTHFGRNWGDDLTGTTFPNAPANFATQLEQLGFSPNYIGSFQGGQGPFIPLIGISGGYVSTGGNNLQDTRMADVWEFGADYTKIYGRHTFKFGGSIQTNNTRSPIYGADLGFAATQTQNLENPANTGNALASFLLGIPDNAGKRNVLEVEHRGFIDGIYGQDQWKITDKLTLNLGIRYDVTIWPIYGEPGTPDAFVGDLNLNNGTYILTSVPFPCSSNIGAPCIPGGTLPAHVVVSDQGQRIYHNDYSDWQGRAGLAYRITNKTVVRAGYGRFYDSWNSVIQLAQNYEGAWPSVGQLLANNLNQPGTRSASIGDPFNLGSNGVILPAPTPFNQVQWFIDPTSYKMPYSDQWNIGVQQQLGQNTVLSLTYVGAHDLQLNLGGYKNTATTPGPGDAATVASRQPYPYISPTYYDKSIGQSKYNAFEFQLQQKSTKGLTYLISYTRSKSIDVGCSGSFGAEGCEVQFPYNLNLDRSVSGFDVPNVFSGSAVWDIPIGKGKGHSTGSRIVDYIIGNWQLGGIVSFYSGLPFDVTVSNGNLSNTGNTVERANLALTNPYPANKGPNEWLNPAAFATPAPYTFGNLGRNSLRSDATKNLDFSLVRRFPVTETAGFEFRADSFNLTNTPIFNIPSCTGTGGCTPTLGNPNWNVILATRNNPRQLQFALKFLF